MKVLLTRRSALIIGAIFIGTIALLVAGGVGGSALLALNAKNQALTASHQALTASNEALTAARQAVAALHNHNNLSVTQACAHWSRIYTATTGPGLAKLHEAVEWTLYQQLRCPR